jgi:A/G-specific adenine glycosylase
MVPGDFTAAVMAWYARAARDLPWRRPGTDAWGVLVSEVMLQQTPVGRVLPAYRTWMSRWPTPASLAAEPPGEAVRAWGRLGYPRRAVRLHETAGIIVRRHDGAVPSDLEALLALPGVGSYTARAVASFAFGQRHAVIDGNVRRVLARVVDGIPLATGSPRASEHTRLEALLPERPEIAAQCCVALMELGALVCRTRRPHCGQCPVVGHCAWVARGQPKDTAAATRPPYAGSDREARGALLALLRDSTRLATATDIAAAWPPAEQRARAVAGLVADGLAVATPGGALRLP